MSIGASPAPPQNRMQYNMQAIRYTRQRERVTCFAGSSQSGTRTPAGTDVDSGPPVDGVDGGTPSGGVGGAGGIAAWATTGRCTFGFAARTRPAIHTPRGLARAAPPSVSECPLGPHQGAGWLSPYPHDDATAGTGVAAAAPAALSARSALKAAREP